MAPPVDKAGHLGIHAQRQAGLCYIGVDVPVGRLSADQLRGLAALASTFGSGTLRLTVWQNLLISDIPEARLEEALRALGALGLTHEPDPIQAGLVACTGGEGCKFGMAPTKATALAITAHLKNNPAVRLDSPVNIHLTGCTHSCAQHFIGDIGLLGAGVETPDYKGPGFHFFIGGGYGREGRMAVPARRAVPAPRGAGGNRTHPFPVPGPALRPGKASPTSRRAIPTRICRPCSPGPATRPKSRPPSRRRPRRRSYEQHRILHTRIRPVQRRSAYVAQWFPGRHVQFRHAPILRAGPAVRAEIPAPAPAVPVLVLFGSQSGTGEGLAQAFADKLRAHAFAGGGARVEPRVLGMNKYKDIAWAAESRIIMLTSTWGDGDMPDNAVAFWDWLKGPEAPSMAHAAYTVMGLGDRNYTRFCQAGKNLDGRFAELGAKRLLPLCECDTDYEAKTEAWMGEALGALDALIAADPDLAAAIAAAASESAAAPSANGHASRNMAVVNGASVSGANGANGIRMAPMARPPPRPPRPRPRIPASNPSRPCCWKTIP